MLALLIDLGVAPGTRPELTRLEREGQIRVYWSRTPLDLFFSYDAVHDDCRERRRTVPFGSDEIDILSAEDLAVFKVIFDRAKDWNDLDEMLFALAAEFDEAYATAQLRRILDPDDTRLSRFLQALVSRD